MASTLPGTQEKMGKDKRDKLRLGWRQEVLISCTLTHFLVVQLSHGIHLDSLKKRQESFEDHRIQLISGDWAKQKSDWNLKFLFCLCVNGLFITNFTLKLDHQHLFFLNHSKPNQPQFSMIYCLLALDKYILSIFWSQVSANHHSVHQCQWVFSWLVWLGQSYKSLHWDENE